MKTGFEIKELFFDRQSVVKSTDRTTRRVLSRFGAFVRINAKRSIRKSKKISEPGSPPKSKTGLLRKFIYFSYEPKSKSVVVGPVALSSTNGQASETLEYGGEVTFRRRGRTVRRRIKPRPYMRPAFEAEQPKLAQMWKDAVR